MFSSTAEKGKMCKLFPLYFVILSLTFESIKAIDIPKITLSSGHEMPIAGLGTHYRVPFTVEEKENAFLTALEDGYRFFDSAYVYESEEAIGKALKKWFAKGGKREELFISTKLPSFGNRPLDVEKFLTLSLKNLELDYVDMYLIHMPFGSERTDGMEGAVSEDGKPVIDFSTDHIGIWKAMEQEVKSGRIRSIGLSNFNESQILNVYNNAEIKPSNVQVELNLYIQQEGIRKLCRGLNISVTGYSPLGSNDVDVVKSQNDVNNLPPLLEHPLLGQIARKFNKTPAQIALRYNMQIGAIVIPKSRSPRRIRRNLKLFDFTLSKIDMQLLQSLDHHGKYRKFTYKGMGGLHPLYPFSDQL